MLKRRIFVSALATLLISQASFAALSKSGVTVEGTVKDFNTSVVQLETRTGILNVPRSSVPQSKLHPGQDVQVRIPFKLLRRYNR